MEVMRDGFVMETDKQPLSSQQLHFRITLLVSCRVLSLHCLAGWLLPSDHFAGRPVLEPGKPRHSAEPPTVELYQQCPGRPSPAVRAYSLLLHTRIVCVKRCNKY
jgi:hypothetical protein